VRAAATFAEAATPGLPGGHTSNLRLEALALLEAASLAIDAGDYSCCPPGSAQKSRQLFVAVREPLGVAAADVVIWMNGRDQASFHLPFALDQVLLACASEVAVPRVRELLLERAQDTTRFARSSHAFPERDILALAIYHNSVPFDLWREIYETTQREAIPHFELEIAAVLAAFAVGMAMAFALGSRSRQHSATRAESTKMPSQAGTESDTHYADKLHYLALGYALRDIHLKNSREFDLAAFTEVWQEACRERESWRAPVEVALSQIVDDTNELQGWITRNSSTLLERISDTIAEELEEEGQDRSIHDARPIKILCCYSHEDEDLRDRLAQHLSLLTRMRKAVTWHDRLIVAGQDWDAKIKQELDEANIILLLISPGFLSSDYCCKIEAEHALLRERAGEARVVPVIIRHADWQHGPFRRLQALPKDGRPVTAWPDIDEAFVDVTRGIRRVITELQTEGPNDTN
jgi:hypothetical protein